MTGHIDSVSRFLVDGMLGSLATKLRILGFDAEYDRVSDDSKLIERSMEEERMLLTSDVELQVRTKLAHVNCILLMGRSDKERLTELFSKLNVRKLDLRRQSRCSACNHSLDRTGDVDQFRREVLRCSGCGKLYWRGAHWKKLEALFNEVNKVLEAKAKKQKKEKKQNS